jgi:divalent metal cation (Fe/Co/Zn/Cd) transporter
MSNIWTVVYGILIGIPKQSWMNKLLIGPAFWGLYANAYTFFVNEWDIRKLKREYKKAKESGQQVIAQEHFKDALAEISEGHKLVFYFIGFFQRAVGAAIVAGITGLVINFFRK